MKNLGGGGQFAPVVPPAPPVPVAMDGRPINSFQQLEKLGEGTYATVRMLALFLFAPRWQNGPAASKPVLTR